MLLRFLFGLVLIAALAAALGNKRMRWLDSPTAMRRVLLLFLVSRVSLFVVAYVAHPGLITASDLVSHYYPEALQAFQGKIPYVDFPSSYGPLFPYFVGFLLPICNCHGAIAAVTVGSEVLAVWLFAIQIPRLEPDSAMVLNAAVFVYALNPATLYWTGFAGYNSSAVCLFWVWSTLLLAHGRTRSALTVLALTNFCVKLLGLLPLPALALSRPRVFRNLLHGMILPAILLITMWYLGMDPFMPAKREVFRSTPGNIWFLASGVLSPEWAPTLWRWVPVLTLAVTILALSVKMSRAWRPEARLSEWMAAISVINLSFMLLSRKSYPQYLPMFLLFTSYVIARSGRHMRISALTAAIMGGVSIAEPPLWNDLGQPSSLADAFSHVVRVHADSATLVGLVVTDLILCGSYVYLLWLSLRLATARGGGRNDPPGSLSPARRMGVLQ